MYTYVYTRIMTSISMPFASICILVLPFASSRHNQWFFPSVLEETQRRQAAESELLRRKPPQTDTSTGFDLCALNLHKLALTARTYSKSRLVCIPWTKHSTSARLQVFTSSATKQSSAPQEIPKTFILRLKSK